MKKLHLDTKYSHKKQLDEIKDYPIIGNESEYRLRQELLDRYVWSVCNLSCNKQNGLSMK